MLCSRKLEFVIEGPVDVIVLVEEGDFDGDGYTDLKFTLTVDESGGQTADLRALMWDVTDASKLAGMSLYDLLSLDATGSAFAEDDVTDLGNGANLNGAMTNKGKAFDAGVKIGTAGSAEDDLQTTSFVITGDGENLTLDDIGGMRFGVRLNSYGDIDGDRGGSLKIETVAPHAPDAVDDAYVKDEDTVMTGNVLDNDTDGDGDTLTVTDWELVSGEGDLSVNADGTWEFIPATGFTGEVIFEYTISDGDGGEDCAQAVIMVNEVAGITVDLQDGLALDPTALTLSTDDGSVANVTRGPDGAVTFDLNVLVPDLPEVADIVLAQDLSSSFTGDLPNLQGTFASDLFADLSAGGADDIGFGVASFIDLPVSPFGNAGDYTYQTELAVTTDVTIVQSSLDGLSTGIGGDAPEAQLIALKEIADRATTEINYRTDAQRFVVLSTDNTYHTNADDPAYPTIEDVALALAAADITPIFAVTSDFIATYEDLVAQLNAFDPSIGGTVVELSSDSENLGAAIVEGLSETTTDVDITVLSDDYGFVSSVTPVSGFDDIDGPDTVTFNVELTSPSDYTDDTITLQVPGFGEVTLDLSFGTEDVTGSDGRDTLSGNNNSNVIDGGARSDVLDGEGGDDTLIGGTGNDILTGGSGADVFVFQNDALFRGTDTVTDYADGTDTLQLEGYGAIGFADLTISDGLTGAEISIGDGEDDPIAILTGIAAADLDATDFIFV